MKHQCIKKFVYHIYKQERWTNRYYIYSRVGVEWVTVMDGVNFEFNDTSRELYHCIQKSVLSGDDPLIYIMYIPCFVFEYCYNRNLFC